MMQLILWEGEENTMLSNQLRMMVGLLRLICGSGGQVEGRVRIQKAAFLLGSKGIDYFDPQDFVYHHHGPYSRTLSDTLHEAVSFDLVEEHRDSFSEDMVRYTYRITEKGRKLVDNVAEKSQVDIAAIAQPMNGFHWRSLELAATVAFLQQHGDAKDRTDAFKKAIHLKPACSSYAEEAHKVLNTVGV